MEIKETTKNSQKIVIVQYITRIRRGIKVRVELTGGLERTIRREVYTLQQARTRTWQRFLLHEKCEEAQLLYC
jgi:hypothetical protein